MSNLTNTYRAVEVTPRGEVKLVPGNGHAPPLYLSAPKALGFAHAIEAAAFEASEIEVRKIDDWFQRQPDDTVITEMGKTARYNLRRAARGKRTSRRATDFLNRIGLMRGSQLTSRGHRIIKKIGMTGESLRRDEATK